MQYWTECDFSDVTYTTSKARRTKVEYLNLEAGFDIETSSVEIEGKKSAFMYIWMVGVGYGKDVYYGRTWEELKVFTSKLVEHFNLSQGRRLVMYIHNLSYEFQFMRHHFEWTDTFNLKVRKPLKVTTVDGIEFRDSFILSGYGLEKTGENLIHHNVVKLVGELDYTKVRHHNTPLTEQELAYCENDIKIITAYINEQLSIYKNMTMVPLTNTARVRSFVKNSVYYTNKNHKKSSKSKYIKYRALMDTLTISVKEYYLLKQAFQGGFVHSNPIWTDEVVENVDGYDFISSYPGVMVTEQFPMSKGEEICVKSMAELAELMKTHCVLMRVRFTGLRSKITFENYLSESKCENIVNETVSNGRIVSADALETTITDIDFRIIQQAYEWDGIQLADVIKYRKGYLPKDIIESIIGLYEKKTKLKGVAGMEAEYLHSKGMLNSIYGMMVTDIVRADVEYKNSWKTNFPVVLEQVNGYNTSKGRFLYYPWGVWTTSYARRNLWSGILTFKHDYLYSDTDGIKVMNADNYQGYIDGYNKLNKRKIEAMCAAYRLDPASLSPKTIQGETKTIGNWDNDGHFDKFKTLGAKRYLVEKDGKMALTVSGVGKRNASDFMLREMNNDTDKVFDMFDNQLTIPAEYSGNLTHTYIDNEMNLNVTDYLGVTADVHTKSGVHLESVEFSLSMSSAYIWHIEQLKQGYRYEGVDTFNV